MNKVAISLNIIGVLAIIGGIVLGFMTYQTPLEGYMYLTEKDYSVLITWIGAGVISGVMFFGFAEIINLLTKQTEIAERSFEQLKTLHDIRREIERAE